MEELAHEDAHKFMAYWYEQAVDEQKAELRQYKKRAKAQVEPVPLTIEEDHQQAQNDTLEPINA